MRRFTTPSLLRVLRAAVAAACLIAAPAVPALGGFTSPVNGGFSNGLTGWTASGDVAVVQAEAILGEQGTTRTVLYQGIPFREGPVQVDFDVRNRISGETTQDPFSFPDTAFVSLYYIDDLPSFDLAGGVYDAAQPLMDIDGVGTLELYGGTVGASAKGPDWMHYSGLFTNANAFIVIAYELFDLNALNDDSFLSVDNVSVLVPEPASLLLMVLGSGLAWRTHRRRRDMRSRCSTRYGVAG